MVMLIVFMTITTCSSNNEESKIQLKESVQQSIELVTEIEKLDNLLKSTQVSLDSISKSANEIISNMDSIERFEFRNEK